MTADGEDTGLLAEIVQPGLKDSSGRTSALVKSLDGPASASGKTCSRRFDKS